MATSSPLLGLPAELRNQIYENVVTTHVTFVNNGIIPPPLARTCQQLKAECLSVFEVIDKSQIKWIMIVID